MNTKGNERMTRIVNAIQIYGDRGGYWVSCPFLDILNMQFNGLNVDFQLKKTHKGYQFVGFIADKERTEHNG